MIIILHSVRGSPKKSANWKMKNYSYHHVILWNTIENHNYYFLYLESLLYGMCYRLTVRSKKWYNRKGWLYPHSLGSWDAKKVKGWVWDYAHMKPAAIAKSPPLFYEFKVSRVRFINDWILIEFWLKLSFTFQYTFQLWAFEKEEWD